MNVNSLKSNLIALLVAMAFLFSPICMAVGLLVPGISDFGDGLIILILLAGIGLCFPKVRLNLSAFLLSGCILLFVIISWMYYGFRGEITDLLINYIAWGIGIGIILMQPYKITQFIKYAYIIAIACISLDLILHNNTIKGSMTWSYAIFPCIAIVICHFVYYRFDGIAGKISYIPGLLMLVKYISYGNRGGLLSLFFLLYFIIIRRYVVKTDKVKKRKIISTIILFAAVLFGLFFEDIVVMLYNFLSDVGISISSVNKTYRLIQIDDITNNREELYKFAWRGFLSSPIFGNGVGAFSIHHGGWTHNMILQVLYEGGLVLFAIILVPLLYVLYYFIGKDNILREEYVMFVLLFSISIPRLLFSAELWKIQGFWMLFVYGILILNKKTYKVRE